MKQQKQSPGGTDSASFGTAFCLSAVSAKTCFYGRQTQIRHYRPLLKSERWPAPVIYTSLPRPKYICLKGQEPPDARQFPHH